MANKHQEIFQNKKVLITGHTGFKGSWLACWLSIYGAKIIALSDKVPSDPSHYELQSDIFTKDLRVDVRDTEAVFKTINMEKPDFIFHLAAQAMVLTSYEKPLETFEINSLGTANILDALRRTNHKCVAVLITSDKCYENLELDRGYKENDILGGKDPYGGSKGAAELIIKSYTESFFKLSSSNVVIGTGRAGNVVGGGDWASDRIIPDCVRAWKSSKKAVLRNPDSTRPWQHVLEPLSGYIALATKLFERQAINGEHYNFGPPEGKVFSVKNLVSKISSHWPGSVWETNNETLSNKEAALLQLNCKKAMKELNWKTTLTIEEMALWTSKWYHTYYKDGPAFAKKLSFQQINEYIDLAVERESFDL